MSIQLSVLTAHLWSAELRINELISSDQGYPQLSWHNSSAGLDSDIVSLADVVDMHWDGCVCANAKLLHLRDELTLCQVIWRCCFSLHIASDTHRR